MYKKQGSEELMYLKLIGAYLIQAKPNLLLRITS